MLKIKTDDVSNIQSSLTYVETIGLSSPFNFADGHAYHELHPELVAIVKKLPEIWQESMTTTIPSMERQFVQSFASLIESKTLSDYPYFSICPTASNSIDMTGAWLKHNNTKTALIEPTFDNLALLLRRRDVKLTSFTDAHLRDLNLLEAHVFKHQFQALFLVNPNNPTGDYLTKVDLKTLADWCASHKIILILDRTFRLFIDDRAEQQDDYAILIESGVTFITIEDTGKTWPTLDMKASLIVYSKDIADGLREIYQEIYLSASIFSLAILRDFFIATKRVGLSEILWDVVAERRTALRKALESTQFKIDPCAINSTLSVEWVNVEQTQLNDLEIAALLQTAGITVLQGRNFYWSGSNPEGNRNIRIAMMKPGATYFESIKELEKFLKSQKQEFINVIKEAAPQPSLMPNIIQTPVWPAETLERHTEALRDLYDYRGIYKTLSSNPRENLDTQTLKRLQGLVTHAYTRIPFYRKIYDKAGFKPEDLRSLFDFSCLPTVTKADLKTVYEKLLLSAWTKINFKAQTSGSTGAPLSLINDTDRQRHWFIKRIHMFEDMMGTRFAPKDWTYSIYYEPFFLTSIFGEYRTFTVGMNADSQELAAHIRRLRPKIITGVASKVMNIAKLLPDAKELGILAFTTNSETSSARERKSLGTHLGVPVLDEYSSEELGIIAWEQRDGSYLVAEDTVHMELVSQGGNDGLMSVVGTDLWNFTMPRIRYEQGDFAEWKNAAPEVGLRSLSKIVGRQDMKLISPEFGSIDPGRILEIFDTTLVKESVGIQEFRLIQKSLTDVQLLVKLNTGTSNHEGAIRDFKFRFSTIFGQSSDLHVKYVSELPYLGVKRRCIQREFHV